MTDALVTYLQDHLAGATFAVGLLEDLIAQANSEEAQLAAELLPNVEADKKALDDLLRALGGEPSSVKESVAWVAQLAGRAKLSLEEPLARFEAIEILSLGVRGKLALWTALGELTHTKVLFKSMSLDQLIERAESQATSLEDLRLKLASEVLESSDAATGPAPL